MDRRTFLATVAGGLLAAPLAAEAQRGKTPVIGVLSPWGPSLSPVSVREPFERGLRELGWAPGSSLVIEQRYADGKPEQLAILATELVRLNVDVIVAHGTAAIRAARQATSTVPIVMSAAGFDPVQEGLVPSLARPGGNLTGLMVYAQGTTEPKRLELLKDEGPTRAAEFDVEPAFRRGIRSRRDERKTVPGRTNRGAAAQLEPPRPSRGPLQTVL